MSIEELVQDTLRERAELVPDTVVTARSAAARARARQLRARRAAAIASLAAVVVAGTVAMVRAEVEDRADGPEPADLSDRVVAVREAYAGRTLVDSAESATGELALRAGSARGAEWLVACTGVRGDFSVHVAVDGVEREPGLCSQHAVLGDSLWFTVPAATAGFERDVRLWVARTDDQTRVVPAGAVVAVAAYALPEPYGTVGGQVVYPVEENFGAEWSVLDSRESRPGDRSVTLEVPEHETGTMLELISSGDTRRGTTVRLVVDGEPVHTVPAVYVLGGRSIGDILEGGVPHRVTLWIPEDVPVDARLGIVVRERVPVD